MPGGGRGTAIGDDGADPLPGRASAYEPSARHLAPQPIAAAWRRTPDARPILAGGPTGQVSDEAPSPTRSASTRTTRQPGGRVEPVGPNRSRASAALSLPSRRQSSKGRKERSEMGGLEWALPLAGRANDPQRCGVVGPGGEGCGWIRRRRPLLSAAALGNHPTADELRMVGPSPTAGASSLITPGAAGLPQVERASPLRCPCSTRKTTPSLEDLPPSCPRWRWLPLPSGLEPAWIGFRPGPAPTASGTLAVLSDPAPAGCGW